MISISPAEFDQAVRDALATIPEDFRPYLENVIVEVREHPTPELLEEYDAPDELLGLYIGIPLEEKASSDCPYPDQVLIFRNNLCAMCDDRQDLLEEIRITVLHEIGHHFGLDEDRLEELGYD